MPNSANSVTNGLSGRILYTVPVSVAIAERKRRAVRGELSEVALRLLTDRAFDTLTIDQIAAAAGVSRRTFFRYFTSKEDVVFAFLDHSGRWQTSSCSGNVEKGIVAETFNLAATPLPRESPATVPLAPAERGAWPLLVIAIGGPALFAFGFLAGRQRRWTARP